MTHKKAAPYDERNASDYREMSRRIADALEEIERDPDIPVTQKELAKRAKCNRGTLRNRGYPLTRLRDIAAKRKENSRGKSKKITREHRTEVEVHIEDKKRLLEQIEKIRTEAATWFNKSNESEEAKGKIEREKEALLSEIGSLNERIASSNERIARLEKELARRKAARGTRKKEKKKVLPFPKVGRRPRGRGEGEGGVNQ